MLKYIANPLIGMPTVMAKIPDIDKSSSMFSGKLTPP
jgi:hypothetical protein